MGADELLIVLPQDGRVDARLSSRLMEKALAQRATVWTADPAVENMSGESLAGFCDALCVPLLEHGDASGKRDEPPLGALHVYRLNQVFTQRESASAKFWPVVWPVVCAACATAALSKPTTRVCVSVHRPATMR